MVIKEILQLPWNKETRISVYDKSGNICLFPPEVANEEVTNIVVGENMMIVKVDAEDLVSKMANRYRTVKSLEELATMFEKGTLYQLYRVDAPTKQQLALISRNKVFSSRFWDDVLINLTEKDLQYFYVKKEEDVLSERAVKRLCYFNSTLRILYHTNRLYPNMVESYLGHVLYPFDYPLYEVVKKVQKIAEPYEGRYDDSYVFEWGKPDVPYLLKQLSDSLDNLTPDDEEMLFGIMGDIFQPYPIYYQKMRGEKIKLSNLSQCRRILSAWAENAV